MASIPDNSGPWLGRAILITEKDFHSIPHLYKEIGCTFLAVLSKQEGGLKKIEIRHPLEVLGVKRGIRELMTLGRRRVKLRIKDLFRSG